MRTYMGNVTEKSFLLHANSKGADQPAHERSLISAFAFCALKSIIDKLAACKIFRAEHVGLSTSWVPSPKAGFLPVRPI